MNKSIVSALLVALALSPSAFPDQTQPPPSEEKELQELMTIVQQETAVATKTRMNSDYVPGIVTVLDGDELEALGIATAGEALGLVPGMQALLDGTGSASVAVRGLDFPFNSGNIQILINSIPLARQDSGINSTALLIPIEQVERIEVIRGPGSVVYGDFAFMGLVNIITRKSGTRAFTRLQSPRPTLEAGARTAWEWGPASMSVNAGRFLSNNAPSPEPSQGVDDHRTFAVLSANAGGLSLSWQTARRTYEGTGRPGLHLREDSSVIDGRYAWAFTPTLRSEMELSYLHNDLDNFISQFRGSVTKFAVSSVWDGLSHQSWLVSADYTSSLIDDASHRLPPPPGRPFGAPIHLVSGVDRVINGVTLQDRVDILNALTLTLGARYDSYSDLDTRVTPRASLVWRINDAHILKAQYAEGFRPPTFFEQYTPPIPGTIPRFPFEKNATTELNYTYRRSASVGRLTAYRTVISDIIRAGGTFVNKPAHADGLEAEWSQQISAAFKLDANAAYVHTLDPRVPGTSQSNRVTSPFLTNLMLLVHPASRLVLGARWNHVADPKSGKGYDVADLTVSRQDLFRPGIDLRAGIKNASDSAVNYLNQLPTGQVNAFLFPGRTLWAEVSWRH